MGLEDKGESGNHVWAFGWKHEKYMTRMSTLHPHQCSSSAGALSCSWQQQCFTSGTALCYARRMLKVWPHHLVLAFPDKGLELQGPAEATKHKDFLWLSRYSFMLLLMERRSKRNLEYFHGPFLICRFEERDKEKLPASWGKRYEWKVMCIQVQQVSERRIEPGGSWSPPK